MAANKPKHRKLASIGNYQLLSLRLGEGSFSKVELANHVVLHKKVAIKVIRIREIEDPYVKKNLHREAAVMAKLNHPNVVRLHEVCSHAEFFCLAMDFYSGGTLCELVCQSESGKLDELVAKIYFKQMMDGLNHIHNRGIIHRDIKLENIFLNHDKSVAVIGDFGLSNFWTPGAQLKTRCGSAEYAAPELLDKKKSYTPAIDIWSSGVVLFAMLTGQLPFNAEETCNKVTQLYEQIKMGLSEANFNLLRSVSIEARKLLCNILAVDVSKRIQMPQIKCHSWFSDEDFSEESGFQDLSLDMQMEVAKSVQTKLKLDQWNPTQILAYVMSSKGRFGKTAGCYNLLAIEAQRSLQESKAIVKPPTFKITEPSKILSSQKSGKDEATQSCSLRKQTSQKKLVHQEKPREKPKEEPHLAKSFWETGQGRAAVFALSQLRSEQVEAKEEFSDPIIAMPPSLPTSQRRDKVIRPFFMPKKMEWRRSIRPVTGHQRLGRLKRVDTVPDDDVDVTNPRKPLGKIDPNVV